MGPGSIVSGSNMATKITAPNIVASNTFIAGGISIAVKEGEGNQLDGLPTVYAAGSTNSTRMKITPGEATGLYQVSLGGTVAQTAGVNVQGQITDANPQAPAQPSLITVPQSHLPEYFT